MRNSSLILVPSLLLAACGGVSEKDPCRGENPDETLNCLGVPPDDSERTDNNGDPLPLTYSPLGPTTSVGVSREFFTIGMRLQPSVPVGDPVALENRAALLEFADDDTGEIGAAISDLIEPGTPWEQDTGSGHIGGGPSNSGSQATRDAVAADFDADGTDEIVVVYLDESDPVNAGVIFVEPVNQPRQIVATVPGARDVSVEEGDFDGDGRSELAIAVSASDSAIVFVAARDRDGNFATVDGSQLEIAATLSNASLSIELAAGNIDRDGGDELALTLNEFRSLGDAITRHWVRDDATASYATLIDGAAVTIVDDGSYTATVADVAIGDIDADGKGEVILAGLEELTDRSCGSERHLLLALDDAADAPAPLAAIGNKATLVRYAEQSGCSEVSSDTRQRHVFVNALDIDSDGVAEIQANLRIYDDFRAGPFTELLAIDDAVFAGDDGRGGGPIATTTVAMSTGDVNGDGREEIVVYAQWINEIVVWGLDGPNAETAQFREMASMETERANFQTRIFPIIVAANTDSDGAVLKYSDVEHKFVFTEPIIMAAVAAAPCAEGIGQNLDACSTSYGLSEASSGGVDASVTVSASTFVSFEAKDPFFGIGVEGKSTITASASFSAGLAYQLEESIEYTTGSLEDTVIFTTIPLDQYSYTVVSHPDPDMVGQVITVNMPRRPVTLQVEREFYNASVTPGSPLVDSSVFDHVPGDIDSYPTEAMASALTADGRGLKASREVTVGQGTGQTSTEISFTQETSYRAGAEISYEKELAVSGGGVSVGGSIGGSIGAGISWGSSSSTVYRGTIGSIDEANFAENLYSAGLFTYIHNGDNPSAPQFEVINYWVSR